MLSIPNSLRGHHKALSVQERLLVPPCTIASLVEGNASLVGRRSPGSEISGGGGGGGSASVKWNCTGDRTDLSSSSSSSGAGGKHLAEYVVYPPMREPQRYGNIGDVKMEWGNTQEATSVLAVSKLFFCRKLVWVVARGIGIRRTHNCIDLMHLYHTSCWVSTTLLLILHFPLHLENVAHCSYRQHRPYCTFLFTLKTSLTVHITNTGHKLLRE
jgi:hypothetical protein